MNYRYLALAICFGLSFSAVAQQTVSPTEVVRRKAAVLESKSSLDTGIPFLQWEKESIWIEEHVPLLYCMIKGRLLEPMQQLQVNGKVMTIKSDGKFEIFFKFPSSVHDFKITLISKNQKTYRSHFQVVDLHQRFLSTKKPLTRAHYSAGLGYTLIHYQQSTVSPFHEGALTFKGGFTYELKPDVWDLNLGSFLNVFTLKSSSADGDSIRYLGLNAKVGYHLITFPSPIRLILNAGIYYNTSFGTVGFLDMFGPQLYPEVRYLFANNHALTTYGKYSPSVAHSLSDFGKNREIATGLHYSFPLNSFYRLSVGIDYSELFLLRGADSAQTSTFSLSSALLF